MSSVDGAACAWPGWQAGLRCPRSGCAAPPARPYRRRRRTRPPSAAMRRRSSPGPACWTGRRPLPGRHRRVAGLSLSAAISDFSVAISASHRRDAGRRDDVLGVPRMPANCSRPAAASATTAPTRPAAKTGRRDALRGAVACRFGSASRLFAWRRRGHPCGVAFEIVVGRRRGLSGSAACFDGGSPCSRFVRCGSAGASSVGRPQSVGGAPRRDVSVRSRGSLGLQRRATPNRPARARS